MMLVQKKPRNSSRISSLSKKRLLSGEEEVPFVPLMLCSTTRAEGRRRRQRHQNIDQNQSNALNVPVGPSSVEGNSKFLACQDCRGRRLEREREKEGVPSMFSAPKMSPLSNKRTHTYIRVVNSVTDIHVCLLTSIHCWENCASNDATRPHICKGVVDIRVSFWPRLYNLCVYFIQHRTKQGHRKGQRGFLEERSYFC